MANSITNAAYTPIYAGMPVEDIKLANKELADKYIQNKSDMDAISVAAANLEVLEKDLPYKQQAIQQIDNDVNEILQDGNYEYASSKVTNSAKKFMSNTALPKAAEAYKELKAINAATKNRKDIDDNRKAIMIEMNNKSYSGVQPLTGDPKDGYTYSINPISVGDDINGTDIVLKNLFNHFEFDETRNRYKPKEGSGEFVATTMGSKQWLTKEELMAAGTKYLQEHNDYQNRNKPLISIDNYYDNNKGTYNKNYLLNNKATINPDGYVVGDGIFVMPEYTTTNDKNTGYFDQTTVTKKYTPEEAYNKLKAEVLAEHEELRGNAKENQQLIDNYIKEKSDFQKKVYNDVYAAATAKSFLKTSNETIWEQDQVFAEKERRKHELEMIEKNKQYDKTSIFKNPISNQTGLNIGSTKNFISGAWDMIKNIFNSDTPIKHMQAIDYIKNKSKYTKVMSPEDITKLDNEIKTYLRDFQASMNAVKIPFITDVVNQFMAENMINEVNSKNTRTYKVIANDVNNILSGNGKMLNPINNEYITKIKNIAIKYKNFNDIPEDEKYKIAGIYSEGVKNMSRSENYWMSDVNEIKTFNDINNPSKSMNVNGRNLKYVINSNIVGQNGGTKMIFDANTGTTKSIKDYTDENKNVILTKAGRLDNNNSFRPGAIVLATQDGTTLFLQGTAKDEKENWNSWSVRQVNNSNIKDVELPIYYDNNGLNATDYTTKTTNKNVPTKRIYYDIDNNKYKIEIKGINIPDNFKPSSTGYNSIEEVEQYVDIVLNPNNK